jgi:hypothetical protein
MEGRFYTPQKIVLDFFGFMEQLDLVLFSYLIDRLLP